MRIFLIWLFCLFPGTAALAAQGTILVYGDSLSAGYGVARKESWVTLLEERLARGKFNHRVVNASISGETSAGGASRIGRALEQHRPSVLVLALGANDGLRGLPLDQMKANLARIVRAAQQRRAQVLLVGMHLPPNYGPAYTRSFHESFRELAREQRVAYLPFLLEGFADRPEYFQADGIHPNAAAQPLILDTVWKSLAPLLRR
ncbi:MAG: arylesterase [Thiobacillaceae bacterium]|jgi:acyl-CoA thioesterase-1|nr:arylesterase [Thiobacillaceae bacterium]